MSKKRSRNRIARENRRVRRIRQLRQHNPVPQPLVGGGDYLNLVAWNCNGLLRSDKIDQVAEAFEKHKLDLIFLTETHIRAGAVEDLSSFRGCELYTKNRSGYEKRGGGQLILVRSSINHMRHVPGLVMFPYLDAERDWVLVHEGGRDLAICSVYLAADVGGTEHIVWNADLINMIQAEMVALTEQGYACLLVGDFNGHIGCDDQGVVGNNPDINYNGRLIREFVFNNDLVIVNADKDRCSGTFTRVVSNSVSLLDLAIEGRGPSVLVHSMVVDELNQFLTGSDHSPLIVTLNVGAEGDDVPVAQEIRVPNPSNLNKDLFQFKFMTLCERIDWGGLDVSQNCEALQNTLVLAADQAGVPAPTSKRSSVASKALGRARARCMRAEAVVRRLSIEQRVTGFPQCLAEAKEAELAEARWLSDLRSGKGSSLGEGFAGTGSGK